MLKNLSAVKVRTASLYAAIIAGFLALLAPSFASAATVTPEDIVSDQFSSLQGTLTSVLIPAMFALGVLGIVATLAWKYLRKGASKA